MASIDKNYRQCCGSGSGTDPDPQGFETLQKPDPVLEVLDPAPDPELDFNLNQNHKN
jgi:hypothetical protein